MATDRANENAPARQEPVPKADPMGTSGNASNTGAGQEIPDPERPARQYVDGPHSNVDPDNRSGEVKGCC